MSQWHKDVNIACVLGSRFKAVGSNSELSCHKMGKYKEAFRQALLGRLTKNSKCSATAQVKV